MRIRDGERFLTDGPAAEIREPIGGYTLVGCADLDEAMKWASTLPPAAAAAASAEARALIDTGRR